MNKNKVIILKINQVVFLVSILKNEYLIKKINQEIEKNKPHKNDHNLNHYEIVFSDLEIENILDDLSYELTLKGMNKEGKINKKGELIEEIIDLFSSF